MESCVSNPDVAQALLLSANLNKHEVFDLVEKYSREARRLHVDIKHERERKILSIRHELEAEISEYVRTVEDWGIVERVVEACVPSGSRVLSPLSNARNGLAENNFTLNINPQIIDAVNGVVARNVFGDQYIGTDAKQLLDLIDQYAGEDKAALISAAHELNDISVKVEDRMAAKYKLKGFVYKVGGKVGDIATGILQRYVESQMGL